MESYTHLLNKAFLLRSLLPGLNFDFVLEVAMHSWDFTVLDISIMCDLFENASKGSPNGQNILT